MEASRRLKLTQKIRAIGGSAMSVSTARNIADAVTIDLFESNIPSLRDLFAAAALSGMCAYEPGEGSTGMARLSYEKADAMLEARKTGDSE